MKLTAYVNTKSRRADGSYDAYLTQEAPVKETARPWKGRTQSGYGRAMPTEYMVFFNNRWQRVKCVCFSNSGSLFIGRYFDSRLTVSIERN